MFKVAYKKKLVTTSTSLKRFLWGYQLYQVIMDIHDVRKNKDVRWALSSQSDGLHPGYQLASKINRVKKMFKMDFTSPAYANLVQPTKVSEEGMENFMFAFTLLGGDVNLTTPSYEKRIPTYMVNPRITFNVREGTVMMDRKPKESAYVSCSFAGGPTVQKYSFQEAVFQLISIFEPRIYFGLIATYVAPPILLGILYHFLLKKRIEKKYWVSWHPFAWGF